MDKIHVILAAIIALDTALSLIPSIKASSTAQLIFGWVQKAASIFGNV